jgi:NAD(P)-dependent dehydrogenase (short-subunit alcohol dehydrogenase family)
MARVPALTTKGQAMTRSIVITGCSTGLGRAAALHLARRGWRVFATVRQESDQANLLVEAMAQDWQDRLIPVLCDITQPAQVERLGRVVADAAPALDALVNNAGTAWPSPLELLSLADLRAQLEVNVVAHLAVTQALLPQLKAAQGHLINVSSVGGRLVYPITGPYHISKFALEAMSDALRIELAPFGVKVVVVRPGSSPTAIWTTSLARAETEAARAHLGLYLPLAEAVRRAALASAHRGFPPEAFGRLVERILANPRPTPRYTLPAATGLLLFARALLPDRLWDWGVRRLLRW